MKALAPLLCLLLLLCSLSARSQGTEPQFFPPAVQHVQIAYPKAAGPLVMVGPHETTMNALILSADKIQSAQVYKGEKAVEKFGERGREGALVLALKEEVTLSRLPEIFTKCAVSEQERKLTVAINGKHVPEPELLLADLRQIESVEVRLYDVTAPSRWTFDEEYLNIVTVQ